ncbi:unnamed protein product, partial [Symbiodinium microadriaticum]
AVPCPVKQFSTNRPIQGFPVAGDRLANHLPIQAVLPICPFQWQPAAEPARQQQYDATALQAAVVSHSCAAQALQQAVAARAALLPEQATIEGTHRCLNGILLEETCRHFPPQPKPDCRVSADVTFRASAKHTWGLYRQMKAIAGGSLKGIWQKWRAYAQFTKASRLLKQQSKQLKAVFHHDQLQRAEHAAKVGDQRGLFQVLKQLAPRRLRGISRLKDAEGRVLSAQAELQAVMDYSKATFACHSDEAFDSVSRGLLTQSLQDLGVPGDIIAAIQQLHKEARYHFDVRTQTGHVTTTNGIKQGCRVAPVLWVCFSISVMKGLIGHRDLSWVQRILTLFADDLCACWTITSKADFLQAIRDVELLLELLAIFKLSVNYKKTALLLRLEGKDADRILGDRVFQEEGKTFLRLQVLGRHQSLQIKESHEYLGTKIAYWKRLDLNTDHRIAAAPHKYTMIRRVLNGKGPLGKEHKLRLWQACISTSLIYSLEVVGFTVEGVRKLQVLATRHIRAILRQPVHITRLSNQDLWQATRLEPPGQLVHTRLSKFCAKRDPLQSLCHLDIVTNDLVHASLLRKSAPAHIVIRRQSAHPNQRMPDQQEGEQSQNFADALIMNQAQIEADIFRHCMPFGQALATSGDQQDTQQNPPLGTNKRQRPLWPPQRRQQRMTPTQFPATYQAAPASSLQDPTVQIMGKLLLKHESFLSNLRKDMGYVMFFKQDQHSILPALMAVAKANREKAEAGSTEVQSPLRTLLLNCLLKELIQRAQKVSATEEGRASLQQAKWLNSEGQWNYLRWDSKQRCLVPDTRRAPLLHENAIRTLDELQSHMSGEIIHRFQSTQGLQRIEEEGHQQATFSLIISLRHPSADDVHSGFGVLSGNALTSLVGMSMKKDDLPQQHLAKLLGQEIYRRQAGLLYAVRIYVPSLNLTQKVTPPLNLPTHPPTRAIPPPPARTFFQPLTTPSTATASFPAELSAILTTTVISTRVSTVL